MNTTNKPVISINEHPISKKDFMGTVENEIIHLHETGDINRVMTIIKGLDSLDNITGHAKARLLWASSEWYKLNVPGENFSDHVESTTDTKKSTVDRYVTTWKYVEDCVIPKEIAERPLRDLVPIAMTLKQGYDISKEQWRKIKNTTTDGELRDVLREVKGKQPRKSARVIKLKRDGSLVGYKGEQQYFIGFLNIKDAENDLVLAEFIEKIKISVGIVEE
jgi:DNA-binding TFAR19-related protein (PDSD5 family)